MHKTFVLVHLILGLINLKLNAQGNLIPNYSFENYISCPNSGAQIYLATPWIGSSGGGGVEYYNSCGTLQFSVPYQGSLYYQLARTGNAYAGLFMLNGYGGDYREYLQVELIDSLESGKCYFVKFYVNLLNNIDLAVNNVGLYFSDSLFTTSTPWEIAPYSPQILRFGNKPINDTVNWVEISGVHIANGGEKFISIGNFFNDINTDTIHTGTSIYNGAYYYIDDVSVIPIDSIPGGIPAYAGVDTDVTLGDSVFIGQQISNLNCNWYDSNGVLIANNTSGIYVNPTTSTYFVIEQNLCGNITYDTVYVTVLPTSINELLNSTKVGFYPNPNNGIFTIIHNLNGKNYVLEIIDLMGKVVHQEMLTTTKQEIKTKQLSTGFYFVNFKSNLGELMYSTKMSVIH